MVSQSSGDQCCLMDSQAVMKQSDEWQGTSNSCKTCTRAFPDIYALALRCCAPKRKCRHIRQCTSACVATNMLHF